MSKLKKHDEIMSLLVNDDKLTSIKKIIIDDNFEIVKHQLGIKITIRGSKYIKIIPDSVIAVTIEATEIG